MKKILNLAAIFAAACIICLSVTSCAQPSTPTTPSETIYNPNGTYSYSGEIYGVPTYTHTYKATIKDYGEADTADALAISSESIFAFSVHFVTDKGSIIFNTLSLSEAFPECGKSKTYTYTPKETFGKTVTFSFTITAGATREDPITVSNFTATEK